MLRVSPGVDRKGCIGAGVFDTECKLDPCSLAWRKAEK
jgi:hypothetical protein